jgi:F-type H+-transporting ATPase subunit epsilon
MAKTLLCEIVTPERIVHSNEVLMVVAMTTNGEIGILPLHAPLVAALAPGEVRLKYGEAASEWETFSVSGGYIQVHEDKVIVLADAALPTSQIDKDRALESKRLVEQRLADLPEDAVDERAQCLEDLQWCELQIQAVEKQKSH